MKDCCNRAAREREVKRDKVNELVNSKALTSIETAGSESGHTGTRLSTGPCLQPPLPKKSAEGRSGFLPQNQSGQGGQGISEQAEGYG